MIFVLVLTIAFIILVVNPEGTYNKNIKSVLEKPKKKKDVKDKEVESDMEDEEVEGDIEDEEN